MDVLKQLASAAAWKLRKVRLDHLLFFKWDEWFKIDKRQAT